MKKIIVLNILLIFSIGTFAKEKYVHISKSILINAPLSKVFNVVKNTMNDHLWRDEVNSMTASGDFEIGTIYTEDAHIGLAKNFITRTQLVEFVPSSHAYYITPKDAPYFLQSNRNVLRIDQGKTLFTYTVTFDASMSKATLGVKLPAKVLEKSYGVIINKYLRNLKRHLQEVELFE